MCRGDPAFPGEIPSIVQYEDIDLEELFAVAKLDHIKQAMEFIHALENASLDDRFSKLCPETLQHLQDPPTCPADIISPDLCLGLDLFLSTILEQLMHALIQYNIPLQTVNTSKII